ncbi:hypothetical protein ONA91_16750 [Micromonospora sp. DR5-3]|uniref:hypothetical protein n=1 Tax=unclassified Micromonospora TaxID=2617518 RepID=UPI0011D4FE9E|nr:MULTISPECIES: hypothetical protein [unclassified Micromonospora]MCW3816093.1 hypothetical protein [Micromonospora sp. DR5-3]TYC22176.1 hypothetical protein FXF52_22190 [Micromonospora sp. MP36]
MNTSEPSGRERGAEKLNWIDRRREKIRAEIERNRRGEHKVPTWVLGAVLVLIVVGWLAFIFLAG